MFSFCNSGAKVMKKNENPTFTAKKSKVFCFPCILKVCLGVKTYCLTSSKILLGIIKDTV